jgi:hypothetical protein
LERDRHQSVLGESMRGNRVVKEVPDDSAARSIVSMVDPRQCDTRGIGHRAIA